MTKTSYREPDYAFGQRMLALRMAIGLTQAALADLLGVSRHAVGAWETGQSYPKAGHLQHFIALGLQQQVFTAGREAEEIRALWRAAHQKVLLDERWLHALLNQQTSPPAPVPVEQSPAADRVSAPPAEGEPRVDWGDALDVPTFYGRAAELTLLSRWVVEERCRVVSVVGMGGVGKSALAVTLMRRVAPRFEVVIWRSLRDAPACDTLLADCLRVLAPSVLRDLPDPLEGRLRVMMEQLRARRVLLVLDNLELLLEDGTATGRMRAGAEGYARLLRQVSETAHASCLLLTSREKPADLVPLEGSRSPVRALRLEGLDGGAGARLLVEEDVGGSPQERARLVELYQGNPLALKIVAQTIVELFGGEVVPFLEQGEVIFGGVRELLDEHFERFSPLEQRVFFWLAILREPVLLEELLAVLSEPHTSVQVLEALDGLRRRSLIERGHRAGSFTLQSVVLEYATARLVMEASREIEHGQLDRLIQHGLCLAQAKEYVRQVQERLLLVPLLARLQRTYHGQAGVETPFHWLLDQVRGRDQTSQGYGPANLVTLLRVLKGNLRGLDLTRLALRDVPLQDIEMQDTRLSGAVVQDSVFTEAFSAVEAIAVSSNGQYWAAATWRGKVRVWGEAGKTLHGVWSAHISNVSALAFSPDGRTLVSASFDNTIKLWEVASGTLLWIGAQTGSINAAVFAPDGHLIASGGNDGLIHLWDPQSGTEVQTLVAQGGTVNSLAWCPDGKLLAGGCADGSIWIWNALDAAPDTHVRILAGHTHWVPGLAFAPDCSRLVSASFDGTVRLWDIASRGCLQTFSGHTAPVIRIAWSFDGRTVASCGVDLTIWLWDVKEGRSRAVLHGHTAVIYSVAFTPDSRGLLSCSDDGTIRVWDVDHGQCVRIMEGFIASLLDLDWSPDGTQLACGGADTLVTLWDAAGTTAPRILRGHRWLVRGVAWSPNGELLASAGYDNSIRLWDTATGVCLQVLQDPDAVDTIFFSVAWSPDGRLLACGSYMRGMQVWDVATRSRRWVERAHPDAIRSGTWSPDGTRLAAGGDDGSLYIWDASDGTLLLRLAGHEGGVMSVAWSPDGMQLASTGSNKAGADIFVWDAYRGERVQALVEHSEATTTVAWSRRGELLISGASDGALHWWDIQSGQCLQIRQGHQGMVQALKVSPDGSRLASCGDDGAIVVWALHSGEQLATLRRDRPYERMDITGLTGITSAQRAALIALGAVDGSDEGRPVTSDSVPSLANESLLAHDRQTVPADSAPSLAIESFGTNDRQQPRGDRNVVLGLPFQPTSFVGRQAELRELARMLSNPACRLVTLLGPGGIGKTRLACEVAVGQATAFADGAAFVALASVGTPNQIVSAIGDTLNLSFAGQTDPTAHMLNWLRERHMLLVLDNFEHLLDGAELVSDILERAPRVKILVTSRERLSLRAEWLFDVEGLAYPREDPDTLVALRNPANLTSYSAVQLFVQRATQVQPRLSLSESMHATIVQVCQQVAGMPLAIELAAAGVRILSLAEIERQIGANLDALATSLRDVPARHRSMRAVFDHSWNLLDEPERALFSRLAVFNGGWTAAAAAEVIGATLPALMALVDKSLVRLSGNAEPRSRLNGAAAHGTVEPRFGLLKPIREYALEQLVARGEAAALQQAHAAYYLALAEATEAQWDSPQADAAIKHLDLERDNLRAVLQWARDGDDVTVGLRIGIALRRFWQRRGYYREGRVWLEELLALADDPADTAAARIRMRTLHTAAWLASDQHDFARSAQLFDQSMTLRRALGDSESDAPLLLNAGRQARAEGQYQQAVTLFAVALAQHRAMDDRSSASSGGRGQSLYDLALVRREQGNFAEAVVLLKEGIALHRAIGEQEGEAIGLLGLSDVARDQGDAVGTRRYSEQSVVLARELGVQWAIGFALNNLALATYLKGDLNRASALIGESITLFRGLKSDASLAEVLITQGKLLRAQGNSSAAYAAVTESLRLALVVGPRLMVAAALEEVAGTVVGQDRAELPVRLLAAASAARALMGTPVRPVDRVAVKHSVATARSHLGADAFTAVWSEGSTRPLEQILLAIPTAAVFDSLASTAIMKRSPPRHN